MPSFFYPAKSKSGFGRDRDEDDVDDLGDGPPRVKFTRSRCWSKRKLCAYPDISETSISPGHEGGSSIVPSRKRKERAPSGDEQYDHGKKVTSSSVRLLLEHSLTSIVDHQPNINLSKSLLLNRRAGKIPAGGVVLRPSAATPTQTMLAVMETLVSALEPTTPLFEFGPSDWESLEVDPIPNDGRISRFLQNIPFESTPDSGNDKFSKAFPSQLARQLFSFYVTTTSRILITMATHGPNPFLSLTSSIGFFDTSAPENCALRMGMLATSANHYVYVIRSAPEWEIRPDPPILSVLENIGKRFKMAALSNLTIAASNAQYYMNDDIVLATCLTLINRDVMSADTTWQENLDFAVGLINKRGGPQKMLELARSNTRRFLLESLATHEFESIESSRTSWEWESVERQFGFSRPTVDLVSRIATLYSRKRRLGLSLKTDSTSTWRRKVMSGVSDHLVTEATLFLTELDIWGNSLRCLPQHPRVNCGDQIYRYTMMIHLLADSLLPRYWKFPKKIRESPHPSQAFLSS
ncbi:hypothetical protein BCR39DRAFT_506093 [Naematelia encephala]|uniref:Uncharacterized protein n=1 Tax=Naematelia encephala TaxID=71784 RepID=A0A1Y2B1G1_9TREE|nr:hypothetical protein BCR39DRAFT_506093 [Naematelia encephala]